jgi:hypothetical protein
MGDPFKANAGGKLVSCRPVTSKKSKAKLQTLRWIAASTKADTKADTKAVTKAGRQDLTDFGR